MLVEHPKVVISPPGRLGTALGNAISDNAEVWFLFRSTESNRIFQDTRENQKYFPRLRLADSIHSSVDPEEACYKAHVVILAPNVKNFRTHLESLAPIIIKEGQGRTVLAHGCKGLEDGTNMRMSEVIRDVDPRFNRHHYAVISGPNLAHEVVRGLPAATVIASEDGLAKQLQRLFRTKHFLPFVSDDVVGVELGGALKNPMAMAVGICFGMGLGYNASAAFMNRCAKEMIRLAVALGADERTLTGQSGIADLSVSCWPGAEGRNYTAGVAIGKGENPAILKQSEMTIEAFNTIKPAVLLARKNHVNVPILEGLERIVNEGANPNDLVRQLVEGSYTYEDPQPVIGRLKAPLRSLNRVLHNWNRTA